MKTKLFIWLLISSLFIGVTACATYVKVKPHPTKEKTMPPGQVKKITGSKSAKKYAPGHNK